MERCKTGVSYASFSYQMDGKTYAELPVCMREFEDPEGYKLVEKVHVMP